MAGSSPVLLRFASPDIQAIMAGLFQARTWGRAGTQLDDDAMRLLGDASLLLNLTYCAEPWSEHEWRLLSTASGGLG